MQGRFARTTSGEAAIGIPLVGGAARCRDPGRGFVRSGVQGFRTEVQLGCLGPAAEGEMARWRHSKVRQPGRVAVEGSSASGRAIWGTTRRY